MKFGLAHRLMTNALAALGVAALFAAGSFRPWVLALAALQGVRVVTRRGAAHDTQIVLVALLHFVVGTMLGGGALYLASLAAALVVAPGALVLSHLRREVEGNYTQGARDRTGLPVDVPRILRSRRVVGHGFLATTALLSVPIVAFVALVFLSFPRLPPLVTLQMPTMPFTIRLDLGSPGEVASDPAIVLRFTTGSEPPASAAFLPLYLRGAALDTYDGRAWRKDSSPRVLRGADPARDAVISFEHEPFDPPTVLVPARATAIAESDAMHYVAYVAPPGKNGAEPLSEIDRARYLALPESTPRRVRELAHEWADAQPTPPAKARAIAEHLARDYVYDVQSPSWGAPQPIDHFLFVSRRGHCEFFATALALLLREVGVPSRGAAGFLGGTYNRFGGFYAVRQKDAHAWVEAYVDGRWEVLDATPPRTSSAPAAATYARELFEGYGAPTQLRLVGAASWRLGALAALAIAAVLVAYALAARRRSRPRSGTRPDGAPRGRPAHEATRLYRALDEALGRLGISRSPSSTPLSHAETLSRRGHPLAADVGALTSLYLEARFGGRGISAADRRDFERRLRKIRAYGSEGR